MAVTTDLASRPAPGLQGPPTPPPLAPRTRPDERPARHSLLEQVGRLEEELSSLFVSTWPRRVPALSGSAAGGPRMLSLAELEELRDELAGRVDAARRSLSERTRVEEGHRQRIEEMLLEPERHAWVQISNEDIGEAGCHHWHVRPRWGVFGYLMNWWRVRISSGCPLAGGVDPHSEIQRRKPKPRIMSRAASPKPPFWGSRPSWVAPS